MILASILIAEIFSFGGGSSDQFVAALSAHARKPVILLSASSGARKAWSNRYEDLSGLKRGMRGEFSFFSSRTEALGFSEYGYPPGFFFLDFRSSSVGAQKKGRLDEGYEFKNGKLTAFTKGGQVLLSEFLSGVKPALSLHWFFDGASVIGKADRAPIEDVAEALASALGGKVTKGTGTLAVDFDPAQYRERGVYMLGEMIRKEPKRSRVKADCAFTLAVLKRTSDAKLQQLFAKKGEPPREILAMPDAEVQAAALEKVKALFPVEKDGLKRDKAEYDKWNELNEKIDWDIPAKVVLSRNGFARAVFTGRSDRPPFQFQL